MVIFLLIALAATTGATARGRMEKASTAKETGAMMSAQAVDESSPRFARSTGKKVIFSNLPDAQALAQKGPTVLFFAADWCPTCRLALKDINANGAQLNEITVVVVDYDKAADLKAKYGVTSQHTYVQIDALGEKLAIWNGGGVDGIVKNVKRG
jgi:thiol-disulfide isomerase/thioredoxin